MSDKGSREKRMRRTLTILKLALLVAIVVALPIYIIICQKDVISGFRSYSDAIHYLRGFGIRSVLIYLAAEILQIVVSVLPGEIFQFAAGSVFGFFPGLILTLAGCAAGETVAYYLARFLGEDGLELILGKERMEKYVSRFNSEKAYILTFLVYLIPGIPKDLVCYAAGISRMKFRAFLLLSLVGRIPALCGCLLFGDMMMKGNYRGMIVIGAVCGVILLLCFIFRKRVNLFIDQIYEKIS